MAQMTFGGPQTQEMDIFTDTTADDTTADNNVVYDAGMFTITNPLQGADYSQAEEYYYGDTYVAEDGLRYNENGERVYRYQPPGEGGSGKYGGTDFGANDESEIYGDVGFYTEAEIRELWNSGEMGNTADQFDSFEDYLSYIKAVDEFRSNPEYQATYDRRQEISRIGLENGLSPEEIQAQIDAELGEAIAGYEAEWQGIRGEYGVDDIVRTENGDVYKWNGYAYTKTYEVNTAGELMKAVVISGIGMALGGPLTAALQGAGMGAAAASALSAGIMSSATQLIATGEIDPAQALMSAILAGAGEYIKDPTVLNGIAGDIATAANEYTGKIDDFINSTVGNEFLQTAISAGLKDAAIQAITTGDVNFQQVLVSGGTAAAMKYLKQFFGENMTEESNEEFEAWLNEQEAMDAQYPNNDPFGEWVEMDDGTVLYSSEGDYYYADGTKATLEAIGVNAIEPQTKPEHQYDLVAGRKYFISEDGTIYDSNSFSKQGDMAVDNDGNVIGEYDSMTQVKYTEGGNFVEVVLTDDGVNIVESEGGIIDADQRYIPGVGYVDVSEPEIITGPESSGEVTYGRDFNKGSDPAYRGTIYSTDYEQDVYYDDTTNTYYTKNPDGSKTVIAPEIVENFPEQEPVEPPETKPVTTDTQEVTSTKVEDATTVEPTTTGGGATDVAGGSPSGATGTEIPQGVDPVLMTQLQDAIRRGDNQAANEIVKQIQQQQQEQQQSEQDQEQVVDTSTGTDYSAEEPQQETEIAEGKDTEEQVVTEGGAQSEGGETTKASGTDSTVTQTSGDTEGQSAGSNGDMTFGGPAETTGASAGEGEGTKGDESAVAGEPSTTTPGPAAGQGGPVTIINNYGGGGGMLTGPKPVNIRDFKPFMTGLSEGKAVVQETYTPPQKDYVADLDAIIKRSMFRKLG